MIYYFLAAVVAAILIMINQPWSTIGAGIILGTLALLILYRAIGSIVLSIIEKFKKK